jgi:solute:Na+ symporter, SSS family
MHVIDWIFVALPLMAVFGIGLYTHRYMKSVSQFMSGGRVAGRYLLAVSRGEMQAGAVVFAALFEIINKAGFTWVWWGWIGIPVGLMVSITGFVVYRYRETRAMTLAQFFEIRYSKRFRIFTGYLGFFAGVLNFGIIPVIGARFIATYIGLPPVVTFMGMEVGSHLLVMAILLSVTLAITLLGGQVTVMVTDCIEGIISQVLYLVIIVALLMMFDWGQIMQVMSDRPPGQSLINPFDSLAIADFNLWFVLMSAFVSVYGTMAWQNQSAYNAAGITAHENRMGMILGRWREFGKQALVYLLAICAITYLLHPAFQEQAAQVEQALAQIPNEQAQTQMRIPMAVSDMLPIAIKGAFCAILIMGIFGGDSTHLHSWGGMLVQDVMVPMRKKPFGAQQHIRALRRSIFGVAAFVFVFGAFFPQTEYIAMWWAVTTAIYVGGAGSVIIGGLYWKKGTTAAAWAALITGSGLAVGGILARLVWTDSFPLNGMQVSFTASLTAVVVYIVVSLLTCREDFNMDRMLHRGKYEKIVEAVGEKKMEVEAFRHKGILSRVLNFNEHFTKWDRLISYGLVGWSMLWFMTFVIGSIWNLIAPWPIEVWKTFWHITGVGIPVVMALVTAVWFTWGGLRDIRDLFRRLRSEAVNELDDGTVVGHQNFDEVGLADEGEIDPSLVRDPKTGREPRQGN